jgi:hypothetical protein
MDVAYIHAYTNAERYTDYQQELHTHTHTHTQILTLTCQASFELLVDALQQTLVYHTYVHTHINTWILTLAC